MKRKFTFPIRIKTVIIIVVFGFVLASIAMLYFDIVTINSYKETYKKKASNYSYAISEFVDVDKFDTLKNQVKEIVDKSTTKPFVDKMGTEEWNDYIAQFNEIRQSELYLEMKEFLNDFIGPDSEDIDSIYLGYVDPSINAFVYVVDGSSEDICCPPGCLDEIISVNSKILKDLSIGFPAYFTNTKEYGYLVTAGTTFYSGNEVAGYAMVDISMDTVLGFQRGRTVRMLIYLMSTVVILIVIGIIAIHFILIKPLKKLNDVATAYDVNNPENTHTLFSNLEIHTHDELHDLALSMKRIENDVYNNIQKLTKTNEELANSQHRVEEMRALVNKDALTGVRNKSAYDQVAARLDNDIKNGMKVEFGIAMIDLNYLKTINDEYGHTSGDIALVKLTNIICATFVHSPVFRIGGDEFVVVMRNTDYNNSETLIKEFDDKIQVLQSDKELPPAERTSASLGYATYDKEKDTCVEDVFRRADELMYRKKRKMKERQTKV